MSWANGLLHSMRDESLIIIKNPLAVVIKDKFPKGKFHFLVISEKDIPNIFKLQKSDLGLLDTMESLSRDAIKTTGLSTEDFMIGYHWQPSMNRLHLHTVSKDFVSPCLKTKAHWNSFNTAFLLSCEKVKNDLTKLGRIEKPAEHISKDLLATPLKCNKCSYKPKNMPDLKKHLDKCVKKS